MLYETLSANETDKRRLPMFGLKVFSFGVSGDFVDLAFPSSDLPFEVRVLRSGVVNCEDDGSGVFTLE